MRETEIDRWIERLYASTYSLTLKLSLLRPALLTHVTVLRVPVFFLMIFPHYYFMRSPLESPIYEATKKVFKSCFRSTLRSPTP